MNLIIIYIGFTMKWKDKLLKNVIDQLQKDVRWVDTFEAIANCDVGIHLAVCNEPFLSLIYSGEKKIESRFSLKRISPFEKVHIGDIIILKKSGGPVTGVFVAGKVKYFNNLNNHIMKKIEVEYGRLICTSHSIDFWKTRHNTKYASLIEVKKVKKLLPFLSEKKDRTAWTVLRTSIHDGLFKERNEV